MRYYKVIKRETRDGFIFKVIPQSQLVPFGFVELKGTFQSFDLQWAKLQLRTGLNDALKKVGIG